MLKLQFDDKCTFVPFQIQLPLKRKQAGIFCVGALLDNLTN